MPIGCQYFSKGRRTLRGSPKRKEQKGSCEKSLKKVKRPGKRSGGTNSLKVSTTSRLCQQRVWLCLSNGRIQSRHKMGLVQTFMKISRYYLLKMVKITGEGQGLTGKMLKTNGIRAQMNLIPILTWTKFYHYKKSPPIVCQRPPHPCKKRLRSRYFVPSTSMAAFRVQ